MLLHKQRQRFFRHLVYGFSIGIGISFQIEAIFHVNLRLHTDLGRFDHYLTAFRCIFSVSLKEIPTRARVLNQAGRALAAYSNFYNYPLAPCHRRWGLSPRFH